MPIFTSSFMILFVVSVVQINIKRCHSDGCDARIHLLRVSGLKYVST